MSTGLFAEPPPYPRTSVNQYRRPIRLRRPLPVVQVLVDDIPALIMDPSGPARGLALWLPYLGGSKEEMEPALARLAEAGFAAASFDPWMHGARANEDPDTIRERVLTAFRREMWPILGRTTLDALRLVDWMIERTRSETPLVVAGGYSMGGDAAIALAGIDQRIRRVATIGSTRPLAV
jgi:uncharacterized protein